MSAPERWLDLMPEGAVPEDRRGLARLGASGWIVATDGVVLLAEKDERPELPNHFAADRIIGWLFGPILPQPHGEYTLAALRAWAGEAEWPRWVEGKCEDCNGRARVRHQCDCAHCGRDGQYEPCEWCDGTGRDGGWEDAKSRPVHALGSAFDLNRVAQALACLPEEAGPVLVGTQGLGGSFPPPVLRCELSSVVVIVCPIRILEDSAYPVSEPVAEVAA
jgi:hypothetical protein